MIDFSRLVSTSYRNRLFWLLQGAGWSSVLLLGTAFAGLTYLNWSQAALLSFGRMVFGIAITCVLRILYRYLRERGISVRQIVLLAILVCLVVSIMDLAFTRVIGVTVGLDMQNGNFVTYLRSSLAMRWMIYAFWTSLYFCINYWLDTQRIQLELAEAEASARASELKALKAQINPHFLFNALGSMLAESGDNQTLRNLTLALSDYLRFSLQHQRDWGALGNELDALENYLRVEKARFEEHLEYRIQADERARRSLTPNALVQPLLENAIKYGQQTSTPLLKVSIKAAVTDGVLVVRVANSGEWVSPETNYSTKTGLANLRRRLELLYGGRAALEVSAAGGEVSVTVSLPARFAAGAA